MTESYTRTCEMCSFVCHDKRTWYNHRKCVKHKKLLSETEHTARVCDSATMNDTISQLKLDAVSLKKEYDEIVNEKDKEIYKLKLDLELANFKLNFYTEQKQTADPSGNVFNININGKGQQSSREMPTEPSLDDALDLSIIDLSLNELITHEYTPTQAFQKEILKLDKEQRPIQYYKKELYVKNDGVWNKGEDAKKILNRHSAELFQNLNDCLINNLGNELTDTEQYNYMKANRLIYDDFTYDTIVKGMKYKL
jgi:hypothetical protein